MAVHEWTVAGGLIETDAGVLLVRNVRRGGFEDWSTPGGVIDAYLKPAQFKSILANDLSAQKAAELAATQRPLAASAITEPSGTPAWTSIPSWDVIGTADHVLPPAAQEFMAKRAGALVTKVNTSHLSMISDPVTVEHVIENAARCTS